MSPPKSKVPPHLFVVDPDVPPDQFGRRACLAPGCHLMGKPGDAHHTLPDGPPMDVQRLAAGEDGDDR